MLLHPRQVQLQPAGPRQSHHDSHEEERLLRQQHRQGAWSIVTTSVTLQQNISIQIIEMYGRCQQAAHICW